MSRVLAAVLEEGNNGYDAVRSLEELGVETLLLSPSLADPGRYRGATLVRCPDPEDVEPAASFFNQRVAPGRDIVLVAASDKFALFLARCRRMLQPRFRFVAPGSELAEALHDKHLFHLLCREKGVSCPATYLLEAEDDIDRLADELPFPCIVKPRHSRGWTRAVGYKVQRVLSLESLRRLGGRAWATGASLLVQDDIPGGPEEIFFVGGFYDERSRPEQLFIGQKLLQYPLYFGSTCAARLHWNQEAVDAANAFAAAVGLSGLVDIEFKRDGRDGSLKIIEVNLRNGLWHRISHDGRLNVTAYYYLRLSGGLAEADAFRPHEDGRRWLVPYQYLCSSVEAFGLVRGGLSWLREMRRTSLRCATDVTDVRRSFRHGRVVLGHLRRLSLGTLRSGRGAAFAGLDGGQEA